MTRFSAILDACVLVPVTLADTLLRIAEAGLYRPLWSAQILTEVAHAIEAVHPDLPTGAARRRVAAMDEAFPDASVSGWEYLMAAIDLPDLGDRHVVEAAVTGRADVVVTANLKDYPADVLAQYDLEVQSPDVFLLHQLDLDPANVMTALSRQARSAHKPAWALDELLSGLSRCGVPEFAQAARAQKWRTEHLQR